MITEYSTGVYINGCGDNVRFLLIYRLQTALRTSFLLGDFSAGVFFGGVLAQLLLHDDSSPVQIPFPSGPPYNIPTKINSGPRTYAHQAKSFYRHGSWAAVTPGPAELIRQTAEGQEFFGASLFKLPSVPVGKGIIRRYGIQHASGNCQPLSPPERCVSEK